MPRSVDGAGPGVRFTDAHSPSAVCSPSRYGLLTGRYPLRRNLWGPIGHNLPLCIEPGTDRGDPCEAHGQVQFFTHGPAPAAQLDNGIAHCAGVHPGQDAIRVNRAHNRRLRQVLGMVFDEVRRPAERRHGVPLATVLCAGFAALAVLVGGVLRLTRGIRKVAIAVGVLAVFLLQDALIETYPEPFAILMPTELPAWADAVSVIGT